MTTRSFRYSIWVDAFTDGHWQSAGGIGPDAPVPSLDATWREGRRPCVSIGAAAPVTKLRAVVSVPLLNFAHVVGPDCGRHYVMGNKSLDIRRVKLRISGQMVGHPFLALAGEGGEFLFAFGILLGAIDVEAYRILPTISKRNAMVGGDEFLTIAFEWEQPSGVDGRWQVSFLAARDQPTWFHALREYSGLIRMREAVIQPHNDAAWDATWCTWTAFSSATMNTENVLANARHARDLGIKTIILDDGWFGPGLDDDGDQPLNIGDYYPDPAKFPDLPKLVRDMQALGMRVLLWHAPLCVANTSQVYPRMQQYLMRFNGREFYSSNDLAQLCPANPHVRAYVYDEIDRMLRTYGVDGFKLDLFNCLPPGRCECATHEHDIADSVQAVAELLSGIWERVRRHNPNALVELKQDYGNTQFAQYGTMVRAGDTAYDADTNARRCFYTQAVAQCVHNDYLVTSVHTDPDAMALLMIRSLTAGVPTFGLDLDRIGPALRGVIGWWLAFYDRHRAIFQTPREPQNNDLSVWEGGKEDVRWVSAIFTAASVTIPDARRVYVLNGTSRNSLFVGIKRPMHCRVVRQNDHEGLEKTWHRMIGSAELSIPSGAVVELVPSEYLLGRAAAVADDKRTGQFAAPATP